jgi:hypothetical protein
MGNGGEKEEKNIQINKKKKTKNVNERKKTLILCCCFWNILCDSFSQFFGLPGQTRESILRWHR